MTCLCVAVRNPEGPFPPSLPVEFSQLPVTASRFSCSLCPAIHCRWAVHPVFAEYFCPWPPGPCCSAFVSLLSLCGNQRKHTVQCSLPVLEPLTRVVAHDASLIWVLYIPCGLCLGSFQRFSPPGNVVLNFCREGNRDWPTEIEPKPFYHWLQWKPV